MFLRYVNGRAYPAETERIGGRVVQRHLGPADPDTIMLVEALRAEDEVERQEWRRLRAAERQRDEELNQHWRDAKAMIQATLEVAGYDNPRGRGWGRGGKPNLGGRVFKDIYNSALD
jgi:hypothetical protein